MANTNVVRTTHTHLIASHVTTKPVNHNKEFFLKMSKTALFIHHCEALKLVY